MNTVETGVACPHCKKGAVVAKTNWTTNTPEHLIPMGPGSRDYFSPTVLGFHCNNTDCSTMFWAPPGKPDMTSVILARMREERDNED